MEGDSVTGHSYTEVVAAGRNCGSKQDVQQ